MVLSEFLQHCQDHFVTMLVGTTPVSEQLEEGAAFTQGLSWDRIDAFASALLAIIASDSQR
jgi:hypothetical protein